MEIAENNLSQLDSLPNRFDFVIYPQQFKYKNFLSQELDACFKNLIGHFKGKIWSGYSDDSQIKIYLNKHDYSPFSLNLPTFKLDEYKNKYSGHPRQPNPSIGLNYAGASSKQHGNHDA